MFTAKLNAFENISSIGNHIFNICKKKSPSVRTIAKMKNYLNIKNLISLYCVFFFSHVLYGILGLASAAKTAIKPTYSNASKQNIKFNKLLFLERP